MVKYESDFYKVKDIAEKLGISRSKCYELMKSDDLPFEVLRIGGTILVSKVAYDKFYKHLSLFSDEREGDAT